MKKTDNFSNLIQHFAAYTLSPATNDDFEFAYHLKKTAYKEYIEQT